MRFFYVTCLLLALSSSTLPMDTSKEDIDPDRQAALASIRGTRKPTQPIPIEDKKSSSRARSLQPAQQRNSLETKKIAVLLAANNLNSPHSY